MGCCDDGDPTGGDAKPISDDPNCTPQPTESCCQPKVIIERWCNVCGTSPCRCGSPVGCSRCQRSPCCCSNTSRLAQPYYQEVRTCREDGREVIRVERLVGAFKNSSAFCVPGCGKSVRVVFDSVGDVPIGAWLWSMGVGYLTIVGFNANTGEIELRNDCPTNLCQGQMQANPGDPIPACSVFVLGSPNCSGGTGTNPLTPFLDSGFVAPVSGNCIDIAVTNVTGLSVGKNISINSGIYRISAIKSATLITICNDGAGLTPGTVVNYQDAAGNLIVPLILIDVNPCLNATTLAGSVMVCDSGVEKPLTGLLEGQILVLTDPTTGEAAYETIGVPILHCTALSVGLTTDPADNPSHSYLVQVGSTTGFVATDLISIGADSFIIDSIDTATTLHATPVIDPTVITNYAVGSPVCSASCCARLAVLETQVYTNTTVLGHKWLEETAASINTAVLSSGTKTVGQSSTTVVGTLDVINDSADPMDVRVAFNAFCEFTVHGTAADFVQADFEVLGVGSANFADPVVGLHGFADTFTIPATLSVALYQRDIHWEEVFTIPGSTTWRFKVEGSVTYTAGNATNIQIVNQFARLVLTGATQL